MSNGTTPVQYHYGYVNSGQDGADGVDGQNGTDGVDGQNGTDGVDGQDGADGALNTVE